MKLSKFIKLTQTFLKDLERAENSYKKKHGIDPHVWSVCEDDGLVLCARIIKDDFCKKSKKPLETYPKIMKYIGRIRNVGCELQE